VAAREGGQVLPYCILFFQHSAAVFNFPLDLYKKLMDSRQGGASSVECLEYYLFPRQIDSLCPHTTLFRSSYAGSRLETGLASSSFSFDGFDRRPRSGCPKARCVSQLWGYFCTNHFVALQRGCWKVQHRKKARKKLTSKVHLSVNPCDVRFFPSLLPK
jgi:hypothetical protein